jgi:hypothetical protein
VEERASVWSRLCAETAYKQRQTQTRTREREGERETVCANTQKVSQRVDIGEKRTERARDRREREQDTLEGRPTSTTPRRDQADTATAAREKAG